MTMIDLTYGSVCSGIESASVAWEPIGFRPLWLSEVEPFPCAVLKHHWPQVPNLGDMTKLAAWIRARAVPAPLILVGGTPCQDFSVAGKGESLDGDRGQLTITYGDIANAIDEQRDDGDECVIVWENVPGVLSTKDNAFGCLLGLLAGEFSPFDVTSGAASPLEAQPGQGRQKWPKSGCVIGPKRTIAWRVIDAQYFGVAQRRRRVFVVASARDGFDPSKVLFEFEGLRRDTAPSREAQPHVAALTANGVGTCGADDNQAQAGHLVYQDVSHCLNAGGMGRIDYETESMVVDSVCATLDASYGRLQGCSGQDLNHGHSHLVPYAFQPRIARNGRGDMGDLVHSLNAQSGKTGKGDSAPCVAFAQNSRNELRLEGGDGSRAGAVSTGGGKPGQGYPTIVQGSAVRRLTPVECELLQGFKPGHTLLPYGVKQKLDAEMRQYYERHLGRPLTEDEQRELCADGPRYKAIGNSKAVPCIRFVGLQIIKELYRCY